MTTAGQQIAGQANSNKNKDVFGSILYNVKAYGAKGDGVTDDTTKIQSAIDAAAAAGGGIVKFPPGIYLNTGLSITSNNITIQGSGEGITTLRYKSNASGLIGISAISKSKVGVEQLSIDMINPIGVDAFQAAILFKDCSDCFYNNVGVTGQWSSHGLRMEGCTRGDIIECTLAAVTSPYATGSTRKAISIGSSSTPVRSTEIKIIDCTIKDCVGGNIIDAIGVADSDNVTISQNICYNNDYGINTQSCSGMVINTNQCHNNTQIGIDLSNGCTNSIVDGNTCYSNGNDGIRHWGNTTQGAERTIFSNNVCYNNGTIDALSAGIRLSDQNVSFPSKNNIINGNQCYDTRSGASRTQDYGILETANSKFSLITDNICFNNKTANESVVSNAGLPIEEYGSYTANTAAAVAQVYTIPFKTLFSLAPNIFALTLQAGSGQAVQNVNVEARNVTTTTFEAVVATTDASLINANLTTTFKINWTARGNIS